MADTQLLSDLVGAVSGGRFGGRDLLLHNSERAASKLYRDSYEHFVRWHDVRRRVMGVCTHEVPAS